MTATAVTRPLRGLGPWGSLAILFAISACSMADRFILSILAPAIKQDLALSDLEVGLLMGPAIAVFYSIMGVPMGYLADRINRVRFLSVCLVIWSGFTALGGLAATGWQLALTRIGVAVAEGGASPSGISLIADFFPPKRRALASAIHASATSVGMFLAFAVGGAIAQVAGWRMALVAAGLPGIALALVSLALLREPERGGLDGAANPHTAPKSLMSSARHIFGVAMYRRAVMGTMFVYFATSIITAWGPTFLQRKFGATSAVIGLNFGLGLAVIGSVCVLASGWWINRSGLQRFGSSLRLVVLLELAAIAVLIVAVFVPDFWLSLLALCLVYGLGNLYLPIQLAVNQNYLPPNMRATGSAFASLCVVLVVHGTAPPLVGALSDMLEPQFGVQSLAFGMLVIAPAIVFSAFFYMRAAALADATADRFSADDA